MSDPIWRYEPCDPEGAQNIFGEPWPHAARGVRPYGSGRIVVHGFGMTEPQAMADAHRKAEEHNARIPPIGECGEMG